MLPPSSDTNSSSAVLTLRRFIRALVGETMIGDTITEAIIRRLDLESLGDLPEDERLPATFQEAMEAWEVLTRRGHAAFSPGAVLGQAAGLGDRDTEMGILVDVLNFSLDDAAKLLSISGDEALDALTTARQLRRRPVEARVLVVEDEPLTAQHLVGIAQKAGALKVVTAHNAKAALDAAKPLQPDLVLADYDLGDGPTGLDVVKTLHGLYGTTGIFVTAYPADVLTGADHEPAFVLGKPYRDEAIKAALYYAAHADLPSMVGE